MSVRPFRVLLFAAVLSTCLLMAGPAQAYSAPVTTTNGGGCTFTRESHKTSSLSEASSTEDNALCGAPQVRCSACALYAS